VSFGYPNRDTFHFLNCFFRPWITDIIVLELSPSVLLPDDLDAKLRRRCTTFCSTDRQSPRGLLAAERLVGLLGRGRYCRISAGGRSGAFGDIFPLPWGSARPIFLHGPASRFPVAASGKTGYRVGGRGVGHVGSSESIPLRTLQNEKGARRRERQSERRINSASIPPRLAWPNDSRCGRRPLRPE